MCSGIGGDNFCNSLDADSGLSMCLFEFRISVLLKKIGLLIQRISLLGKNFLQNGNNIPVSQLPV